MTGKERFFIPDTIKVGYQSRSDTYTGKLGYVIYYDKLGNLRKEASWNSWRNSGMGENDYKNEPLSGFVINKNVGGSSGRWDSRMSWCRVLDPRGFEFEITIDNFLFILDHCDCTKGKVLSGRFIYSWIGADLVLLPESCPECIESMEASKKITTTKFKATDLVPGGLYKTSATIPWYINYPDDLREGHRVIFVGLAKFQKDFGRRYETRCLFYNPLGQGVFSLPAGNIQFLDKPDYIGPAKCKEVMDLFDKTALSQNFWKTPGIVEKFCTTSSTNLIDARKALKTRTSYFQTPYALSAVSDSKVDVYMNYHRYYMTSIFGGSSVRRDINAIYHSYTIGLDTVSGKIEVVPVIKLGKIDSKYVNYYRLSSPPAIGSIYPSASKEDIEKLQNNCTKWADLDKDWLIYTTTDGYTSESLQLMIYKEVLNDYGSVIGNCEEIPLPLKL